MQPDSTQDSSLITTLQEVLLAFRPCFSQERVYERAGSLLLGSLFTFARKTLTQILTALGQTHTDWTAAYRLLSRGRFRSAEVAQKLFDLPLTHVTPQQPYTAVIDDSGHRCHPRPTQQPDHARNR